MQALPVRFDGLVKKGEFFEKFRKFLDESRYVQKIQEQAASS